MRRFLCWLLGHKDELVREVGENFYGTPLVTSEYRCRRCGEELVLTSAEVAGKQAALPAAEPPVL